MTNVTNVTERKNARPVCHHPNFVRRNQQLYNVRHVTHSLLYPGNVLRVSSFANVSAFPVFSFLTERGAISVHGVESIFPWSRLPMYSPKASRTYAQSRTAV